MNVNICVNYFSPLGVGSFDKRFLSGSPKKGKLVWMLNVNTAEVDFYLFIYF